MMLQDLFFLENLWNRLCNNAFSPKKLMEQIRKDGGYDISGFSDEDILQLIQGQYNGDWKKVISFSELLTYYKACGESKDITPSQVVGWAFSVFMIRDAVERKIVELELVYNFFMDSFFYMKKHLDEDEYVLVTLSFFRSPMLQEWEIDFQERLNNREKICFQENSNQENCENHEIIKRFKLWIGIRLLSWGNKLIFSSEAVRSGVRPGVLKTEK